MATGQLVTDQDSDARYLQALRTDLKLPAGENIRLPPRTVNSKIPPAWAKALGDCAGG